MLICVPIQAGSDAEALGLAASIPAGDADLIEYRLDHWRERPDPARLVRQSPSPCILTCRARREGGVYDGSEDERLALLQSCIEAGAAYVDAEADCVHRLHPKVGVRLIASHHDFSGCPADLRGEFDRLCELPSDVAKLAVTATDLADNLRLFEAMRGRGRDVIGICMGELGEPSRLLGGRFGGLLTFGSLAAGKESAPGQFTAGDLARLYRVRNLTAGTPLFAVAGDPIAHSMSPAIHNTAFVELGMDALYFRCRVGDFAEFLRDFAEPLGIAGMSVTIPHKDAALRASGEDVEDLARQIGAVNTLTRTATGWRGRNTDCEAALGAIRNAARRSGIELRGRPALLLGAGGTARAIGFGLVREGCRLIIANRTRERAEDLARDLGAEVIDLDQAHEGTYAVVANTTSVGMHPRVGVSPIRASVFSPRTVAFDAVYNPLHTQMLQDAEAAGAAIATGLDMFVGQAALQFEEWTARPAPVGVMRDVVLRRLQAF